MIPPLPFDGLLYMLRGREVVPTSDLTWAASIDITDRMVAVFERDGVLVSTVFLGIDHRWMGEGRPLVFETMVFGGPLDQEQRRYCTYAEALAGHTAIVGELLNMKTKV